MKKLILTIAVALFAICSASAANYTINDDAVDALVATSTEMVMPSAAVAAPAAAAVTVSSGQNPIVATILAWWLGWAGVHRYYLGTAPWMVLPYLLTGGGFGILWCVDTVMLLVGAIENTINPDYIGNERIIMWADIF